MKKWITLLLTATLVGACALPVCAEETPDATAQKEILFRDVPWGSDIDTVESILSDFDFSRYDNDRNAMKSGYYISGNYEYAKNQETGTMENVFTRGNLKVAGYDVTHIELNYVYEYPDGIANENVTTKFYSGAYNFECVDYALAGEDLVGKLSGLYGDPVNTVNDRDDTIYTWEGANNTACSMRVKGGNYPGIELTYFTKDCDAWVDAADAAVDNGFAAQESEIYGNGDNSGL